MNDGSWARVLSASGSLVAAVRVNIPLDPMIGGQGSGVPGAGGTNQQGSRRCAGNAYPFNAPKVTPCKKYLWNRKNMMNMGTAMITPPAMSSP